ncbi:hypothetical protein H1D32_17485 [Anaerobacillus sp. CMMVII]|uniref:hypothetical protein n=1 Tax=Anaerobacillus sp. CMMVII TaxID=2755588 RepID=UPI0021B82788|nr:hypothetical protein [Anaerobacillus sp. CMMVII]MCT8139342.1 hypothetical protein [Anaerobacillus sp. CMMVII]
MAKNNKNSKQHSNSDAAALGNSEVSAEVEVRSRKVTNENKNNLHDDPEFYIGQEPDETK